MIDSESLRFLLNLLHQHFSRATRGIIPTDPMELLMHSPTDGMEIVDFLADLEKWLGHRIDEEEFKRLHSLSISDAVLWLTHERSTA